MKQETQRNTDTNRRKTNITIKYDLKRLEIKKIENAHRKLQQPTAHHQYLPKAPKPHYINFTFTKNLQHTDTATKKKKRCKTS
jgi:hypothetical protein